MEFLGPFNGSGRLTFNYVNVIVYLYTICKIGPTVIGFILHVVVILPLFYVVKLK
jgi:hypothetical protein